MNLSDRASLISKIPLFRSLQPQELERLAADLLAIRHLPAQEICQKYGKTFKLLWETNLNRMTSKWS